MKSILVLVILMALARPAIAVDGVLEINQTCAVQTGCFTGDVPGFPITITGAAGKSYRLTSDLQGPADGAINGIVLSQFPGSQRVTIDFNGFELSLFALGAGSGHGITAAGASWGEFATIKNGAIRNARGYAIALQASSAVRVDGMTLFNNQSGGISVGTDALIVNNRVIMNGSSSGSGIEVGDGSQVRENVVRGNAGRGIETGEHSEISGNVVSGNSLGGVWTDENSTIVGNTVSTNTFGIVAGPGSTVLNNNSSSNTGNGIAAGGSCTVVGNTVRENTGFGLSLGTASGYANNVLTGNDEGAVFGAGIEMGTNICGGDTTCP